MRRWWQLAALANRVSLFDCFPGMAAGSLCVVCHPANSNSRDQNYSLLW
jgi:hypothetical protein